MVELLIVISIIAALAGMLLPAISIARKKADQANTENLLRRIDTALESFHRDIRAYPWASNPADATGPWTNDLAMRLTRDLTDAERDDIRLDLQDVETTVASQYPFSQMNQPRNAFVNTGGVGGVDHDTSWGFYYDSETPVISLGVRRIAIERGKVGILSGNLTIPTTVVNGNDPWITGLPLISARSKGWGADYFDGQIDRGLIGTDGSGNNLVLLDRFGQPLIYVNNVTNGVEGFRAQDIPGSIRADWFHLAPADYRSPTVSINSDIRTTAAEAFIALPELWSGGPDTKFNAMRNEHDNKDNVSARRYNKGLQ